MNKKLKILRSLLVNCNFYIETVYEEENCIFQHFAVIVWINVPT